MTEAAAKVIGQHGRIGVLVNNAGVGGPLTEAAHVADEYPEPTMSDEMWDAQPIPNLRTAFA